MSLEDRIREHYTGQALTAAELDAIGEASAPGSWRPTRIGPAVAIAAAVLVLVVAAVLSQSGREEITLGDPAPMAPETMPLAGPAQPPPMPGLTPETTPTVSTLVETLGELIITSEPTDAEIYVDDVARGTTPVRVASLRRDLVHVVRIEKAGYDGRRLEIFLGAQTSRQVHLRLLPSAEEIGRAPLVAKSSRKKYSAPAGGDSLDSSQSGTNPDCRGPDAHLSVMAIGAKGCDVWVGGVALGAAPFFKKSSPSGDCLIEVRCERDHWYQTRMRLAAGSSEKLIIKNTEWNIGEAPPVAVRPRR